MYTYGVWLEENDVQYLFKQNQVGERLILQLNTTVVTSTIYDVLNRLVTKYSDNIHIKAGKVEKC